jgi:hypothetical protein
MRHAGRELIVSLPLGVVGRPGEARLLEQIDRQSNGLLRRGRSVRCRSIVGEQLLHGLGDFGHDSVLV